MLSRLMPMPLIHVITSTNAAPQLQFWTHAENNGTQLPHQAISGHHSLPGPPGKTAPRCNAFSNNVSRPIGHYVMYLLTAPMCRPVVVIGPAKHLPSTRS